MENVLQFLQSHFPLVVEHRYTFLFLGSVIESFNIYIIGGFLVSTKVVSLLPLFFLFLVGDCINGYIWYTVGYFAGSKPIDKWGRKDPKSRKIIEKVQNYFERYSGRAIVLTKFTFSLTIATLIMAGSLKYNLRKFSLYNFIGAIGWVSLTLFTGYFFGQSYRFFFSYYLKGLTYFVIFLGGAIALVYIIKEVFKSAFIKSLIVTERIKEISEKLRVEIDKFIDGLPNKK